jgi:hypothetical protein
MITGLQDDILEIYNSLVEFSKTTLGGALPVPIRVTYDEKLETLFFEQAGKKIGLWVTNWYAGGLKNLCGAGSYLMPQDYDYLMATMSGVIESGVLLEEHTCVSPEMYGFDIWATTRREAKEGPKLRAQIRFVSGNSWLFKVRTKIKYKSVL